MIPQSLKKELSKDKYYKKCCLTGKKQVNGYKIDWHHAWTYAGKNIQEKWAIMPVWYKKHNWFGDKDSVHNCQQTKEYIQYLSLLRIDINYLIKKYSKKNWQQIFNYLNKKYGSKSAKEE